MARLNTKEKTIKALFARSGNQCAFPGCKAPLIDDSNNLIGEVCHIEAASEGGERYNVNQSDDERREYGNLILLCHPHHVETNNVELYPAWRLKDLKLAHESGNAGRSFEIDGALLYKITVEMEDYWKSIDEAHRNDHVVPELAIPIDTSWPYAVLSEQTSQLIVRLNEHLNQISASDERLPTEIRALIQSSKTFPPSSEELDDTMFTLSQRNWGMLNLAIPNALAELSTRLMQMEILYLEEFLKTRKDDFIARARLDDLKKQFSESAISAGYAD